MTWWAWVIVAGVILAGVLLLDRARVAQRAMSDEVQLEQLRATEIRQELGRAPARGGACHPAYPTVCIPGPPPALRCADVPHRRFVVLRPDPHGFDGDRDGVGCELG